MKWPYLKWLGRITNIWTPSPPRPAYIDDYSKRAEKLIPITSKKKANEDEVIQLGDHSHSADPSKYE